VDRQDFYQIFLIIHILAVIVAFGYPMLNKPSMDFARKLGPQEELAVTKTLFAMNRTISTKALYVIPLAGFAMIGLSDGGIKMSETWVSLSLLIYIAMVGNVHAILIPTGRALQTAKETGDTAKAAILEKKIDTFGPLMGVMLVVVIYLMVFKPGA
jgi:uncharacterized membrane protein